MKQASSLSLVRWFGVAWLLLALTASAKGAASSAENRAFAAALKSFGGGWWARAEAEFAEFAQEYRKSERRPEAILRQAQARYQQTNSAGVVELLSANVNQAGNLADEYQFWIGQAHFQSANYPAATVAFARVVGEFTNSARRLEAAYDEALAYSRLGQWPSVVKSLGRPDGTLQRAAQSGSSNPFVVNGLLLLGEAHFAQRDYRATEEAVRPLIQQQLVPEQDWRRQYLVCRAQLADNRPGDALQGTTNLLALAVASGQRGLLAESVAFEAGVLEQLGRLDEAVAAYEKNRVDEVPTESRRQALWKIIVLTAARNNTAETAQRLEKFLNQYTNDAAADVALLALGELRLKEHVAALEANRTNNAAATTNLFQQAMELFDALAKRFPQSPLVGKALLNQGWGFWLEGKVSESRQAFEAACERLPFSVDQAVARFKLADAQYQLKELEGAVTNYLAIVEHFASLAEVKSNLVELALYQTVRAALEAGDTASATNAVEKILAWYPTSFMAGRSAVFAGLSLSRQGDSKAARQILTDFASLVPDSPQRPATELAIASTYEQEMNWPAAIEQYDGWLARFATNEARPRAEYRRALANYFTGRETNALNLFTDFVARFATNELAPLAQYWIADYHHRREDFRSAEENYQLLFQKWPTSELTYQARLMAGRAAAARQKYGDAIPYFTNLTSDLNCPPGMKAQALFEYADATAQLTNYAEAIRIFSRLQQLYPTNDLVPLAEGRVGDCYLQLASLDPNYYDAAAQAYQQVMDSPNAKVAARSQAEVGLAIVLGKQAGLKSEPEQSLLRERSKNHYLNVLYEKNLRDGEKRDPFWVKRAGLEAVKLAEELQMWEQLAKDDGLCDYLSKILPPLAPSLEAKKLKAKAHLNSPGT